MPYDCSLCSGVADRQENEVSPTSRFRLRFPRDLSSVQMEEIVADGASHALCEIVSAQAFFAQLSDLMESRHYLLATPIPIVSVELLPQG